MAKAETTGSEAASERLWERSAGCNRQWRMGNNRGVSEESQVMETEEERQDSLGQRWEI